MNKTSIRRGRTLSIRARVLSIALVPCFVFLLAGAGGAGYLIYDAASTRNYFTLASDAQRAALPLIMALEEERRLTLRNLASLGTYQSALLQQRQQTDGLVDPVRSTLGELSDVAPESVRQAAGDVTTLMTQLPQLRTRVDDNQVSVNDSFTFYNSVIDRFIDGAQGLAQFGPDAESVHQLGVTTGPLLTSVDQMLRADALASANTAGGGLSRANYRQYQGLINSYHLQLEKTMTLAEPAVQERYAQLKETPAWQRLVEVENTLLGGGSQIPISEDLWRAAARDVGAELMAMLTTQARATIASAVDRLDTALTQAIIAGAVVLLLAATLFVFALRLSRRLIMRLTRLRTETLDLADVRLPQLVRKVRTGAEITVEDSVRLVDHGRDELGEVAEAFNKAQHTAVNAAVQEARTREGTNAVFLNIARRSQVIVHRQLKVLDEAERRQEDPEQLEMLFQLDHLSTRARRNAENLIILGGGQPGRRWRNPVSLTELARGAAAETEDFARVKIAKLPPVAVNGPVVGDLVHLLAELLDNASSFSPPDSRVDVRGNVVGRGVVLEIEDQGVGMAGEAADAFNEMLHSPPDFGIMALSDEPRLGLFVVARLAGRHGISVTLRESAYGGTRAIVLVRTELLTDVPADDQPAPASQPAPADQPTEYLPAPPAGPPVLSSFRQTLPEFPVVQAAPGENLFRPQRPIDEQPAPSPRPPAPPAPSSATEAGRAPNGTGSAGGQRRAPNGTSATSETGQTNGTRADHETGARAASEQTGQAPNGTPANGRPPLPQRRRQQNLAPQLREEPDQEPTWPEREAADDTPDAARSRLSAFVHGTRRAREQPGFDETNGNGVRHGQHRAE
ncbi:sensor histidine kinase [Actinophytocola sediminis]